MKKVPTGMKGKPSSHPKPSGIGTGMQSGVGPGMHRHKGMKSAAKFDAKKSGRHPGSNKTRGPKSENWKMYDQMSPPHPSRKMHQES